MSAHILLDVLTAAPAGKTVLVNGETRLDGPAIRGEIAALHHMLSACQVLAVLADNSPAWVIADFAALEAGWVHLPLPGFFSAEQMLHTLNTSAADTCLTDQPERIEALALGFRREGVWNGLTLLRREILPALLPSGTAKISFTSGSTGQPKGVCLSAAGLMATANAVAARLGDVEIERHLAVLPLSLLLENVAGVYAPLLRGAEIFLPPLASLGWRGMAGFNPADLQRAALASGANSMILVPELAKAWASYLGVTHQIAPDTLSFIAVGGARVDASLLHRSRTLGLPLYQGYGLTECGSVVSLNRPRDDGDGVGRPLTHAAIRVVDGEIRVRTPAFLGYLGDTLHDRAEEVRTGDLGHIDAAGHVHLEGRSKNLLITSFGRNIAPEWIESLLLAEAVIAQALVCGEGRPWPAALLVASADCSTEDLAAAVARVNSKLPDYARLGDWMPCSPFTLSEGLATGNGRPVRGAILARHAAAVDALYKQGVMNHVFL